MNKLTPEDIIPYILHKLEVELLDYQRDYVGKQFDTVVGIHQWDKSGKLWCVETLGGAKHSLERIKLVLKPIELLYDEQTDCGIKIVHYFNFKTNVKLDYNNFPYHVMKKLFKNKFDVFDLEGRGFISNGEN